jgi:thioredoxin 1
MKCKMSVTASALTRKYRRLPGCTGRRRLVSVAGFGVLLLAFLAGGCSSSSSNLTPLNSSADFQRQVLQADKPVLVQFYKEGCAWCGMLEPALSQLADDYPGRAVFAKYRLMNWLLGVTNWELKSKYDIRWYPTVILFVNGQEKKRWVVQYDIKSYRKALDEALATPTRRATPAAVAPAPAKR